MSISKKYKIVHVGYWQCEDEEHEKNVALSKETFFASKFRSLFSIGKGEDGFSIITKYRITERVSDVASEHGTSA